MNAIIGLCGGIGSGKSHVAWAFKSCDCMVFDADKEAANCLQSVEIVHKIQEIWGEEYVHDRDGELKPERRKLADLIFQDAEQRKILEDLVIPIVMDRMIQFITKYRPNQHVVIDAPLLFERNSSGICTHLVYVHASDETRWKRVEQRGHKTQLFWTKDEWERRERVQLPLIQKLSQCHFVVNNDINVNVIPQVKSILEMVK